VWPEWCSRPIIRSCDDRDEGSTPSSGPLTFPERSTTADAAGCRPVSYAGSNPAAPTRREYRSPHREERESVSHETAIRRG
jgi:hypothetical protein